MSSEQKTVEFKKLCVVGGAGGLIGERIASDYFYNGYEVHALDIQFENHEKLYHQHEIDLTHQEKVSGIFEDIFNGKEFSEAVLINCQGLAKPYTGDIEKLTLNTWQKYLDVNITSFFLCSREFLKAKQKFKNGSIINLSSTRHLMAEPNCEAYGATKGAIVGFTQSLAVSLSDQPITVNSISPGWIDDPTKSFSETAHRQHPSGRVGRPEDISNLCLYLSSEKATFINGRDFIIDGGMTRKMIYQD